MPIGPETRLIGLIGDPIAHSLSPMIHNTALDAADLDAVYAAFRVKHEHLGDAVRGLRALEFLGANVTIPHKRAVIEYLDEMSTTARAVGAVNTIQVDRSGDRPLLIGDNTDAVGFARPLTALFEGATPESVLILGAGGAARAVTHACSRILEIDKIAVAARRPEEARTLLQEICPAHIETTVVDWPERVSSIADSALIVNTTPIGMEPNSQMTPLPKLSDVTPEHIVYDLVYAPTSTRLLTESRASGARIIGGLEMLIGQAATAFEMWTDQPMPVEVVRAALSDTLATSGETTR